MTAINQELKNQVDQLSRVRFQKIEVGEILNFSEAEITAHFLGLGPRFYSVIMGGAGLNQDMQSLAKNYYRFGDGDVQFLRARESRPLVLLSLNPGDTIEDGFLASVELLIQNDAPVLFTHSGASVPFVITAHSSLESVREHFEKYRIVDNCSANPLDTTVG